MNNLLPELAFLQFDYPYSKIQSFLFVYTLGYSDNIGVPVYQGIHCNKTALNTILKHSSMNAITAVHKKLKA